jgi:hypothetical protein
MIYSIFQRRLSFEKFFCFLRRGPYLFCGKIFLDPLNVLYELREIKDNLLKNLFLFSGSIILLLTRSVKAYYLLNFFLVMPKKFAKMIIKRIKQR